MIVIVFDARQHTDSVRLRLIKNVENQLAWRLRHAFSIQLTGRADS